MTGHVRPHFWLRNGDNRTRTGHTLSGQVHGQICTFYNHLLPKHLQLTLTYALIMLKVVRQYALKDSAICLRSALFVLA